MRKCIWHETSSLGQLYQLVSYPLVIAICLYLAGCVTPPLKTKQTRDRLAEAIGFEPDEIAIMNACFFEEVEESDSKGQLKGYRGIVATTKSELCLVDGVPRKAPANYFLKIPLSQIEGVSRSNGLIQIKHQDRQIVLFLYHWNDLIIDYDLTQTFYESLIFANVPGFNTDEHYSFTRFKSPPKLIPFNDQKEPHDPYRFPDQ